MPILHLSYTPPLEHNQRIHLGDFPLFLFSIIFFFLRPSSFSCYFTFSFFFDGNHFFFNGTSSYAETFSLSIAVCGGGGKNWQVKNGIRLSFALFDLRFPYTRPFYIFFAFFRDEKIFFFRQRSYDFLLEKRNPFRIDLNVSIKMFNNVSPI